MPRGRGRSLVFPQRENAVGTSEWYTTSLELWYEHTEGLRSRIHFVRSAELAKRASPSRLVVASTAFLELW